MVQVFDPSRGNLRLRDPEVMQQQARGATALNQLKGISNGAAMANALRDSRAMTPGVLGQGGSAAGPTISNAIGTYMQRQQGKKDLAALDARSQALRGDTEQGRIADMTANENQLIESRRYNEEQAALRRQQEIEDRDFNAEQRRLLAEKQAGNKIDYGPDGTSGMTAASRRQLDELRQGVMDANNTIDQFKALSQEDITDLSNPLVQELIATATPDTYQNYVNENLKGLSRKSKDFLFGLALMDTETRHAFYGSALSQGESGKFDAIATAVTGMEPGDRLARVNGFGNKYMRDIQSMDPYGHRKLAEPIYFKPLEFDDDGRVVRDQDAASDLKEGKPVYSTIDDVPPDLLEAYNLVFEADGVYDKSDPRFGTKPEQPIASIDPIAQAISGQVQQPVAPPAQPQPRQSLPMSLSEEEKRAFMQQQGPNFPQFNLGGGR